MCSSWKNRLPGDRVEKVCNKEKRALARTKRIKDLACVPDFGLLVRRPVRYFVLYTHSLSLLLLDFPLSLAFAYAISATEEN